MPLRKTSKIKRRGTPPVNKFRVLSTILAGARETVNSGTSETGLLKVSSKEFAEAQVLVFGDVPHISIALCVDGL